MPVVETSLVDWDGALTRHGPHLVLTPSEQAEGRRRLALLTGGAGDEQFVCFHNRDSAYLVGLQPFSDWSYHDFRDSDPESFLEAAKLMAYLAENPVLARIYEFKQELCQLLLEKHCNANRCRPPTMGGCS